MTKKFKLFNQLDVMDCGPTCLRMICYHHGKHYSLQKLRALCDKGQQGVTLLGINNAAEELGLRTTALKMSVELFVKEAQLPCIVHWQGNHFVVVYKVDKDKVYIADPAGAKTTLSKQEFSDFWTLDGKHGIALLLTPRQEFHDKDEEIVQVKNGLSRLFRHLLSFKRLLWQLGMGAILGSILNLIFPFLNQAIVDQGIGNKDLDFIYIILIAQVMLFFSRTANEFIRGWILIHMGTRVNIAILSDFLSKLMRLPLSFFSSRNLGDILQRVADHKKIEEFLTSHAVTIIFSLLNLIIFSVVMLSYSVEIFAIFFLGSIISIFWVVLFLNKRRKLDLQRFASMSDNQNNIVQLINGMPEIKLNQCEAIRRWEWERIQSKLFKLNLKSLAVEQYQQAGMSFLNEGKNIAITFIAAQKVIEGEITLGMMMAITYILGQMNAPIDQLLSFIRLGQDAKISVERLGEIQDLKEEKEELGSALMNSFSIGDIKLQNLSFRYSRHDEKPVLDSVDFTILNKKTTAIVGASGSGKTTLMKLLLKFYQADEGKITLADQDLKFICPDAWRSKCGVVMQDGFIFSESVAKNIAMGAEFIDYAKIRESARVANIHLEIESLHQGYNTKLGLEGVQLSGGQAQRILIARAIYKNPEFLFFDEATSSLDATNEFQIQQNLQSFFEGKTVMIIAHRLSTVKNADQIIVMEQGKVVEIGDHQSLAEKKGFYYKLVQNQLELGN